MGKTVVLRLGGSVITDRHASEPSVNRDLLRRLAREIGQASEEGGLQVVITHGMGSFGHPIAKEYGLDREEMHERKPQGMVLLNEALRRLNVDFTTILREEGLPVVKFPTTHAIADKGRIVSMDTEALPDLLSHGLIPVLQATPVYDRSWGVSILSSDHISPVLAARLGGHVIMGMNVDGIYDLNPSVHESARLLKEITPQTLSLVKDVGMGSYVDATGGMRRTLLEAIEATQSDISSRIVNATLPGVLREALLGVPHGTLISPNSNA